MIKATVLYAHPANPESFEKYYREIHIPLVAKASGVVKSEYTKFLQNADGSTPAYYRSAELYFNDAAQMQQTLASSEGQAMAADLSNFATEGFTIMVGIIDE